MKYSMKYLFTFLHRVSSSSILLVLVIPPRAQLFKLTLPAVSTGAGLAVCSSVGGASSSPRGLLQGYLQGGQVHHSGPVSIGCWGGYDFYVG